MNHLVMPHGGKLVNLMVDEERKSVLKDLSMHLASMTLSARQLCDLELLINGAFSPLTGFMTNPGGKLGGQYTQLKAKTVELSILPHEFGWNLQGKFV